MTEIGLLRDKLMTLSDLPDVALLTILSYCDLKSLGRISQVCKRFHHITGSESVWTLVKKRLTVVGRCRHCNNPRNVVSTKEQCRIAVNWMSGFRRDARVLNFSVRQLPWIVLCSNMLWISDLNTIKCYQIKETGFLGKCHGSLKHADDVCRFVVKENMVVSGATDGSISIFNASVGNRISHYNRCHVGDVQAVDVHSRIVVSGSRDSTVKIWQVDSPAEEALRSTIPVGDRVWSIAMNNDGRSFVVGTAGMNNGRPLSIWSTERSDLLGSLDHNYKHGAGMLDVIYESQDVVLSSGYDTWIRLWDLRASFSKCVLSFEEPFDSAVYCVRTDHCNSILSGSQRHGVVHLWDKRKTTKSPVQVYYTSRTNTPVFSMAFNSIHLYVALDSSVNVLDFQRNRLKQF